MNRKITGVIVAIVLAAKDEAVAGERQVEA